MGPRKKQIVSRSKRPIPSTLPVERRTKARHESSSRAPPSQTTSRASSPPPPPAQPTPFIPPSPGAAERMAGRVISCGRRISLAYFDGHGFSIGQWIRLAGCEHFCTLSDRFYPHLIREFYGSLGRGADGWTATVRGVSFSLTAEVLGQIWGIPSIGPITDSLGDREAGIRCILEREDVRGITTVSAIQLSAEMRLLHHVVARIFLPKTGRFDYITERELMMMSTLVRGLVLNIPGVLLRQMQEAASSSRACLPYGMPLTSVFRHFGVQFDDQLYRVLQHTDTYDDRSLHRMGYRYIRGRWTRRAAMQTDSSDSEEEEIHAAEAGPSGAADADSQEDRVPTASPPPCTVPEQRPPTPRAPRSRPDTVSRSEFQSLRDELHTMRDEMLSSIAELRELVISGFATLQSRQSAPVPQRRDDSDSSTSSPSDHSTEPQEIHDGAEDQMIQEDPPTADQDPVSSTVHETPAGDQDPPITDQDPVLAETPHQSPPVVEPDAPSVDTVLLESDSVATILDSGSQATVVLDSGTQTIELSPAADLSSAPPSAPSSVLGFHLPGLSSVLFRRTSGRTRRISYRTSSRTLVPPMIVCSSDSDD